MYQKEGIQKIRLILILVQFSTRVFIPSLRRINAHLQYDWPHWLLIIFH
jgi:hypothetical protein